MWTVIEKNDLPEFEEYYHLDKYPEKEYILYENAKHIFLPRKFIINYPYEKLKYLTDNKFLPQTIDNIEFIGTLRDHQQPIIDSFIELYKSKGQINGVLNAHPGAGKTLLSVYLACYLKKKTLIVVDNEKLKSQFIETIVKFTNLTENDIGFIQGSHFDSDKKITITLVQTLLSKLKKNLIEFYKKIRKCGFDFIIYDEVHKTSSSSKYAKSTLLINSPNIIGLSATPYVRDMHAILLFNTIGNIAVTSKNYELVPKVFFITYDSCLDNKKKYRASFMKDYIKLQAFYNSIIFDNPNYLNIVGKLANKCKEAKHTTIVLVSNIKQIEHILNHLTSMGIEAKAIYSKQKQIDKSVDKLLIGTFKFCSHGFDFPELSALILASPYKGKISLIQSIGRILRTASSKKQPVIFDLMDIQFPSLFSNNINNKMNIFKEEFGECEYKIISGD